MATLPALTHHDVLELVAPFTRSGRQVDMAQSTRRERRLRFQPVQHAAATADAPQLREVLQLESFSDELMRLTRLLEHPSGAQSRLHVDGDDAAALLARLEAVPPHTQFREVAGVTLALEQRLPGRSKVPQLVQAVAPVQGLRVVLTVPQARGLPADLDLEIQGSAPIDLPEDLLAVIGWNWAPLVRRPGRWSSKLRLGRHEPARSERALAGLERTVAHLVQTFAEPPADFHTRHRAARLGVVLRRAIPVLTAAALVAAAFIVPRFIGEQALFTQLLVLSAPPVLLALGFSLQSQARFEIPPWPRPLSRAAWWR